MSRYVQRFWRLRWRRPGWRPSTWRTKTYAREADARRKIEQLEAAEPTTHGPIVWELSACVATPWAEVETGPGR